MKLIKPYFEILEQKDLFKHIEVCGRTAYKSEDKITEDSAPKFVDMLIKRGHGAVLEHGTVYLTIPNDENELNDKDVQAWRKLQFLKKANYTEIVNWEYYYYITTNYRVIVENNLQYLMKYNKGRYSPHNERISVKFICDRGVSHEFVRHRVFSFIQESTRYCNYSNAKFGTECTFIEPLWLKDIPEKYTNPSPESLYPPRRIDSAQAYFEQLECAEETYLDLLKAGWSPQQARAVLPNSLKTELIMTGTIKQWEGFFKLRCDSAAHPQARELAIPLLEEFKNLGYVSRSFGEN